MKITFPKFLGLVSLVLLGAVACTNTEFKRTKAGLQYKIYSDGRGDLAKKGQFLKLQVLQKLRDSVLYTSYGTMPVYLPVDTPHNTYNPWEIFTQLRKGDSAVAVISVDTLMRKMNGQLPPFLKRKDKITFSFKVMDIFASEDLLNKDREGELAKQKDRETKEVENYLAANHIQAQKTAKGVYYVIENPGEGQQVDSGKQVAVRYTGKLMPSGKVFESNMTGPADAYKLVVGQGNVIPGWDDGLKLFKKGGKGTLYIPAYLAYDAQPGPGHKPFENLVFDIKIEDVTDAPPPAANPGMPGMPQGRPGQGQPAQPQPHK
ncbi:MAG TPA: FKBP-type peptidyl-prolyl cis-trans isomerase [Puia sp.]|uniref:FKBP-type peptidyl-prolyl cis-trans isomerase n=1 Tax=Puia sp. TaxID=2045100 RepID=UPI002CFB90FF|nr:FKBP-type peptidyl-prolyl cis-trans isomerase [Puia sp.]HVU96172.1 FKBP-type peptidyl-prolyl cis-trans isomerase [Puia sp.]